MSGALQYVEQSCNVVISVLEHVATVGKEIHTKFAKIRVVAFSFACTVAEQHVVSHAFLASVHAVVGVPMGNVRSIVQSHVNPATNLAHGVVLITNVTIFVVKNATVLGVTLPVLKSFLAATHALVCVEKTVLLFVPSATLKSSLPC